MNIKEFISQHGTEEKVLKDFLEAVLHLAPGVESCVLLGAYYSVAQLIREQMVADFLAYAQEGILNDTEKEWHGQLVEVVCPHCSIPAILSYPPPPSLRQGCFGNDDCLFGQLVLAVVPPPSSTAILTHFMQLRSIPEADLRTSDSTSREEEVRELMTEVAELVEKKNKRRRLE